MIRSFKFRMYPTCGQETRLQACLSDHRDLYNAAMQERRGAWVHPAKGKINYGTQSAQLKEIRRSDPYGQGRWSFSSQQTTLRRLNHAYVRFFTRVQSGVQGRRVGFPRFKGVGAFTTVIWPEDGDGCRWHPSDGERMSRVYLQGIGHVKVRAHRRTPGKTKSITVKREGNGVRPKWFLVLQCEMPEGTALPATGSTVGIDMGVVSFATTSDGQHVANPRYAAAARDAITAAQRSLERKRPGSNNRARTRRQLGALHAKVARQRRDFHHKTALALVQRYDLLAVEGLHIQSLTRTASGTVDAPGANVSQKAGLNRAILDAGWASFFAILSAKAESAGRTVVRVDPCNTSRECPECGHTHTSNRVTQSRFICGACGFRGHADVVAAVNVLRRGLASQPKP